MKRCFTTTMASGTSALETRGQMVEGKFLKITGRINETFKLENGKFVVPAPLEDAFARCTHVAQVFHLRSEPPAHRRPHRAQLARGSRVVRFFAHAHQRPDAHRQGAC